MNLKVVVSITLQQENQDYFAAERQMREYRRHVIILGSTAAIFALVMVISMIVGGDIGLMTGSVVGMFAAAFAMMAGISYVSGVRDQQKKMRSLLAGTSRTSDDPDAISRMELSADVAFYTSLAVALAVALYVIAGSAMSDLSTSNLSHAAGISTYVLVIAVAFVAGVGGILLFAKYARENLKLLRTQSE